MENIPSGLYVIAGALIASITSIITLRIQKRSEFKKELASIAFNMAKDDRDTQLKVKETQPGKYEILPLEAFFFYYFNMLKLLTSDQKNIEEKIKEVKENQKGFNDGLYPDEPKVRP